MRSPYAGSLNSTGRAAPQRFVLADSLDDEQVKPLSVQIVQNWYEEFRDREQD